VVVVVVVEQTPNVVQRFCGAVQKPLFIMQAFRFPSQLFAQLQHQFLVPTPPQFVAHVEPHGCASTKQTSTATASKARRPRDIARIRQIGTAIENRNDARSKFHKLNAKKKKKKDFFSCNAQMPI
jgi:hypothetical protein